VNLLSLFAILIIVVGCYALASYPVLRWAGVREDLPLRSFKFGGSILGLEVGSQVFCLVLGMKWLGPILGLFAAAVYVDNVISISHVKNLLIVILMPTVAVMICAPLLLLLFKSA
jgi:hypothetical protein